MAPSQPFHRQSRRERIGKPLVGGDEFCLRLNRGATYNES
jgi:hypothetical protein